MNGLTSLMYTILFSIYQKNNKFKLYTDNFREFSFEELEDELEEILSISYITPSHLLHKTAGSRIIQT